MQLFGSRRNGKHRGSLPDRSDADPRDAIADDSIDSTAGEEIASQRPRKEPSPPPKKNKSKKALKIVGIIFLIILILAAAVVVYWHLTTKPPKVANPDPTPTATPGNSAQPVDGADGDNRYYTLLLVGKDAIGANTDTIMLLRYDAVEHKVNVYSIPRDTMVDVPYSVKKINSVYFQKKNGKQGGIDALMDEVKDICGFRPNNYAVVDINIVAEVIDTLGGVDFDVPVNMNYDDPSPHQDLHIHINKGMQHLSGENAVKVFRFRSTYAMGDIDRLNVQHDLLKACVEQWIKLGNIDKLFAAGKIVMENAETDLTYGNIQWYAQEFLKMSSSDISFATMPGNYTLTYHGGSYVGIDADAWLQIVNEQLNPTDKTIEKKDCRIVYQTKGGFAVTDGSVFGSPD